jgi:hypothetical protein
MSHARKPIGILLLTIMILGVLPLSAAAEGLGSAHKYFGFGTIALAAATAATKPGDAGDVDMHENLAYATAACALTTVLLGTAEHRERFDLSDGLFTEDNVHIMLGTIGAVALTAGVLAAAGSYESDGDSIKEIDSHAGLAIAGAAIMTIAIIDIEW